MFFGGLPAELIVQISQYLPFDDALQLAWTDRRIMQIVRRNMPLALYPPLNINCFEIHPIKSMNPNKKEYRVKIEWTTDEKLPNKETTIRCVIRNSAERNKNHGSDRKNYTTFQKFYRFCIGPEKRQEVSWRKYALTQNGEANSTMKLEPPIEIRMLLSRAIIKSFVVNNFNRQQFINLVDSLSFGRTQINSKEISCKKLLLTEEDKRRFEKSPFLQEIHYLEMKVPPFVIDLFKKPNYVETEWELGHMNKEQFDLLPTVTAKCLMIYNGEMSLRNFVQKLLGVGSFKREWMIVHINNVDDQGTWAHEVIENVIRSNKSLGFHWIAKNLTPNHWRYEVLPPRERKIVIEVTQDDENECFSLDIK
ncbi:hypothetical protein WR25_18050 [Diploscapter pachys]|uniref:F-box domain-containing protein n=1 Tax=Diploscapter pachys TaxID=2018661 RepID=A0A2A2JEF3_9BILA|nr:hypothetical protein WR25_18050 [Diploscapter pachys]